MRNLSLLIIVFFLAISFPLTFLIWQTYNSVAREERGQLSYFSETIFNRMETELAEIIEKEENRAVDEYSQSPVAPTGADATHSPLAAGNYPKYILGYLQNNPDGSFQTPLVAADDADKATSAAILRRLRDANTVFNTKKLSIKTPTLTIPRQEDDSEEEETVSERAEESFAGRFLSKSKRESSSNYLGRKQQRIEKITTEQALNIAPFSYEQRLQDSDTGQATQTARPEADIDLVSPSPGVEAAGLPPSSSAAEKEAAGQDRKVAIPQGFQVEVAPFQSVSIDEEQVYVFRRIVIDNQIYRQGFIILIKPLLQHLTSSHFAYEPLAEFTTIRMYRIDVSANTPIVQQGPDQENARFSIDHVFPPPFHFIEASMKAGDIPTSPARRSLNIALAALMACMFLGFLAIYLSVRSIVLMSEKRAQFVSSVTHELKTPLTSIRMYIEMLEQGIAASPEQEQEYLAILNTESGRLSGLINNVLELAKLEKKQRQFHLRPGHIDELLREVQTIMAEKLKHSGFTLQIKSNTIPEFNFDREVLIQILTNLIENSIKFGHDGEIKEISISAELINDQVRIEVSDTGPGIPGSALHRVFDDFYRVDNTLTRKTGGTGIGLSLVKKFMAAMGGRVKVSNNRDRGCTFRLELPLNKG